VESVEALMAKNRGHDYSTLLIWSAALVTVVRYAAAFIASDMGQIEGALSEFITVLMGISGLGMGILDVLGGTYLFDGWRRAMPATGQSWRPRFKVLTMFVFALMGTGVMILVPFTESRVTHSSMEAVLGNGFELTWWALLVNLAPYLLIGGVAVGNQVVSVSGGQMSGQMSGHDADVSGQMSAQNSAYSVKRWGDLTDGEVVEIAQMSTEEICKVYHKEPRSARRWRQRAQKSMNLKVSL
jgi:hypothetical protein